MAAKTDNFLSKLQIRAYDSINKITDWLISKYKANARNFSYSSPFGQIILVLQNHINNVYFYIQDSISQLGFHTANRKHTVFGLARLQGHNAFRGKSAVGQIKFMVKSDTSGIPSKLYIPNYQPIINAKTNISYLIDLGVDIKFIDISNEKYLDIKIFEGTTSVNTFTGTGEDLQTLSIQNIQTQMFDHNNVVVKINQRIIPQYESLYDIPYNQDGCLVKTGLSGGIDVIFGKTSSHKIPLLGEEIQVETTTTKGSQGNIYDEPVWKICGVAYDLNGDTIELSQIFDISTVIRPIMGADSETIAETKILAPNISRSFIIHDRQSLWYYFKKMNYFSHINIYKKDERSNEYTVNLIPKMQRRILNSTYWTSPLGNFSLNQDEIKTLIQEIHDSRISSASISINIQNPVVVKFGMIIFIELQPNSGLSQQGQDDLSHEILDSISEFLLNNTEYYEINNSDIVNIVTDKNKFPQINSAFISFISQKPSYIDGLCNIKMKKDEFPIFRGDFTDQNGNYYRDELFTSSSYMKIIYKS